MTLEEIEERVKLSLEALNTPKERYDWRLTYYNAEAWTELQEGCFALSEGRATEDDLKALIKEFRDRSELSLIDLHIKVAEPSLDDFKRMAYLFGPLRKDVRIIPPRDEGDRKAYMQLKTLEAMRLTMEHKQIVSEKLRQQFTYLMLRASIKTPEMMAVHLQFESYNPYQKHLSPAPKVTIRNHFVKPDPQTEAPTPAEATPAPATPAPAPMFSPTVIDNSSFESRLAPPTKKAGRGPRTHRPLPPMNLRPEQIVVMDMGLEEAPHELPSEIHEEFATHCEELYKTKCLKSN
jgi:hypothetical protein